MSQENVINKYINALATMNHSLFSTQDALETAQSTVAEQEGVISGLRNELAKAKETPVVEPVKVEEPPIG